MPTYASTTSRRLATIVVLCGLSACSRAGGGPDAAASDAGGRDAAHLDGAAALDGRSAHEAGTERDASEAADVFIPEAPTLEEYAALYGDLYCAAQRRCLSSYSELSQLIPCELYGYGVLALGPRVDAGELAFDPVAAAACLRTFAAGCDWSGTFLDPGPCGSVTRGLIADGEACIGAGCMPGSYCTDGLPMCSPVGTCTPLPELGEPCAWQCASGLLCQGGVCAAVPYRYVGLGEACDVVTSFCRPALDCRRGVCVDPSIVGWPGLGEPCGGVVSTGCAPDGQFCIDGICVRRPTAGEPCDRRLLSSCAVDAFCEGGTCRARAAEGAACTTALPCRQSQRCIAGVCEPPRGFGESCSEGADCLSNNCDGSGCAAAVPCL